MSVIIVHGTHDPDGRWWMETPEGSFAANVDQGLKEAGANEQVWRIGNRHVSEFDVLQPKGSRNWLWIPKHPPFLNREGRFKWSGLDLHGAGRLVGGKQLARYLETLSELAPDETIHIIAHSHGCNIVKHATQELRFTIRLGRVVFLACPHFVNIQTGGFPYKVNAAMLGDFKHPILNLYTPQDTVQTTVAELFPDLGMTPGMPAIDWLGFPGTPLVEAHRVDQDAEVRACYDDLPVEYEGGEGISAHGAVHNPEVGRFLGHWLGEDKDVSAHQCWTDLEMGKLSD